jgi:hypothetical protein
MVVYVLCIFSCHAGQARKGGVNLAKIAADEGHASGDMTYFRHNKLRDLATNILLTVLGIATLILRTVRPHDS